LYESYSFNKVGIIYLFIKKTLKLKVQDNFSLYLILTNEKGLFICIKFRIIIVLPMIILKLFIFFEGLSVLFFQTLH